MPEKANQDPPSPPATSDSHPDLCGAIAYLMRAKKEEVARDELPAEGDQSSSFPSS